MLTGDRTAQSARECVGPMAAVTDGQSEALAGPVRGGSAARESGRLGSRERIAPGAVARVATGVRRLGETTFGGAPDRLGNRPCEPCRSRRGRWRTHLGRRAPPPADSPWNVGSAGALLWPTCQPLRGIRRPVGGHLACGNLRDVGSLTSSVGTPRSGSRRNAGMTYPAASRELDRFDRQSPQQTRYRPI